MSKINIKQFVEIEINSPKEHLTLDQKIQNMLHETDPKRWCFEKEFQKITEDRKEKLANIIKDHIDEVGVNAFLLEIGHIKFIPNIEFDFKFED